MAGLVVWLPILVTIVVLRFIVDLLDNTIALLPRAYQPENLFGAHIPGIGVLLSFILLVVTGVIATNILGQRLVSWGEHLLSKIPLVRSVYMAAKQVISAVFSSNSQAFRKVMLIEYPVKGVRSLAFMTGNANSAIHAASGEEMLSLFIPTTPNPTSGFLVLVPKKDVLELPMGVDEALKYIISLGVMPTDSHDTKTNNH